MKFGLFHSIQLPDPTQQVKYYKDALAQVLHAEKLGFDSVWITEHHFSRHGIVSATMSLLAYLAGVTERIRLGTAVTVLPFHNPIQLAEEVATVDLLSDGRRDFGVGRGGGMWPPRQQQASSAISPEKYVGRAAPLTEAASKGHHARCVRWFREPSQDHSTSESSSEGRAVSRIAPW